MVREAFEMCVKGYFNVDVLMQVSLKDIFKAIGAHLAELDWGADQFYLLCILLVIKVNYLFLFEGVFVHHLVFAGYCSYVIIGTNDFTDDIDLIFNHVVVPLEFIFILDQGEPWADVGQQLIHPTGLVFHHFSEVIIRNLDDRWRPSFISYSNKVSNPWLDGLFL